MKLKLNAYINYLQELSDARVNGKSLQLTQEYHLIILKNFFGIKCNIN